MIDLKSPAARRVCCDHGLLPPKQKVALRDGVSGGIGIDALTDLRQIWEGAAWRQRRRLTDDGAPARSGTTTLCAVADCELEDWLYRT